MNEWQTRTHPNLVDWLREPNLIGTAYRKLLPAYESAIQELITNCNNALVSDLVSLACSGSPKFVLSSSRIRQAFKSHDRAYALNDDYHLRVLSGATLMTLLYQNADHPAAQFHALAATAILSGCYARQVRCEPPVLLLECERYIEEQGIAKRNKYPVQFPIDDRALAREQKALNAALKSQNSEASNIETAKRVYSLLGIFLNFAPQIPKMLQNQNILQEESEMAWWVLGEFSNTRNMPFRNLSPGEAPVVLSAELAARTRVLPTGQIALHLISRLLAVESQDVTLEVVVNAVSNTWIEEMIGQEPMCPGVTPVLYALYMKQRSGERWMSYLGERVNIDPKLALSPHSMAYTVFQEFLALRMQRML